MSQVQLLPAEHFSPSVFLSNSRPATNSIAIAEHFGKQHKDVLKSIRNLCAELPEDVRERNFALTFRTVAGPNNSERQEEFFTIYFDGFILLVMGYTGKQALQIKLVYIAKFNEMKEQLDKLAMEERVRAAADDKALPGTAITPEQQAQLKAIADAKIGMIAPELQRKAYGELWSRFTRHFRIARYAQLPPAKMGEAVEYLVGLEIKAIKILSPAPEQKALPAVPSSSASFLSAADIAALEAAGQRVIALSAYVQREVHELHVEILNVLDIRRMPGGRWRAMSSHIWYSLLEAVNIAPESLTRDTVTGREYRNPAYWTLEMLKDMPAA